MMRNLILLFAFLGIAVSSQAQQHKFRVEFTGNEIFSSDTLLKELNFCLAKHTGSEDKYDARLFEYCLQKDVRGFLQSQGYLSAKIGEPQIQASEQNPKISVSIQEGTLYRIGNINIQGSKVFSSEQLLKELNLKTGDIADGQELRQWLFERVKKLYGDRGYIQSDFDLEPTFNLNVEKLTKELLI